MSPPFILGQEDVPCVAEVVNRSLKPDFTDFNSEAKIFGAIFLLPAIWMTSSSRDIYFHTPSRNQTKL